MQENQLIKVFSKEEILKIHNQIIDNEIEKVHEKFQKLTIIVSNSKVQFEVPVRWTLNQVKCMLIQLFPVLDFNKYQLQYNKIGQKQKLSGKSLVQELKYFQLIVVQTLLDKQYEKFYAQKVTKALKKYNLTSKSTIYPILHPNFSKALVNQAPKQRTKNFEQRQPHRPQVQVQQQGIRLINIIRFFGLIVLSNLLFSLANMYQIGILIAVALVYLLMDNYVNQNQRRRRRQRQRNVRQVQRLRERVREIQQRRKLLIEQFKRKKQNESKQNKQKYQQIQQFIDQQQTKNKQRSLQQPLKIQKLINAQIQRRNQQSQEQINRKQNKVRRPIKAKFILWMSYLIQLVYCYVLSVFPNWTVQTHLHANEAKMNEIMNQVKQLDPQASEAIKKWKIKKPLNWSQQQ